MDEPLSNLDARLRGQMRAEIARMQKMSGITTVYVTHDQVEAMTMGDRVAVMKSGVLQQLGTPRSLYDQPANLFVASFMGSPAMNLLAADLFATENGPEARFGQASILSQARCSPSGRASPPPPGVPLCSASDRKHSSRSPQAVSLEPLRSSRISAPTCSFMSMSKLPTG